MINRAKTFRSNTDGNVAMIFGIMLIPILIAIGAAIDYSRLAAVNAKLQDAADAAALSAALAYSKDSNANINQVGGEAFEENAYTDENLVLSGKRATLTNNGSVEYALTGKLDPMFMQIFGHPKLDFEVTSEASLLAYSGLEVAIAFDATNSMAMGSSWDNAMTVVENSLEEMKGFTGEDNFYVSLVPFSDRVNIGTHRAHWLSGIAPSGWEGCVEPREYVDGAFNWAVNDDPPSATKFDATVPGAPIPGSTWDTGCPDIGITGPTQDTDEIVAAAKSLTNEGSGRFDTAMAWSWRLLSPKWSTRWDVTNYPAATTKKRKKKIIFMTDAKTRIYSLEMSKEADWGHNLASKVGLEHVVALCGKIKDEDIEIYILQMDGNPNATPYLQACASTPDHYYTVENSSEISVAFTDILGELEAELRIVR